MPVTVRSSHPLLNIVLAAGAAATILIGLLLIGPPSSPTGAERVVTAERGVVQSTVSGAGSIQAPQQISVSFKSGGRLSRLDAQVGQHVRRGDVLAQVDPVDANITLAGALAGLHSAQARVQQVEQGLSPQEI